MATTTNPAVTVLTAAQITAKLSNQRKRGEHPITVKNFILSGDMYRVLNDNPAYGNDPDMLSKKVQGLKQAYKNIRQTALVNGVTDTPEIEVVFDKAEDKLYLINVTATNAALADA